MTTEHEQPTSADDERKLRLYRYLLGIAINHVIRLRHWLGFHGRNWRPVWIMGNVWTECEVCHARRMVPFGDVSEMPLGTTIANADAAARKIR